jgi:hypothetical protein
MWMWIYGAGRASQSSALRMMLLLLFLLLLEHHLLREVVALVLVLGVIVVNECLKDVAVNLVLIRVVGQNVGSIWVSARAPIWVWVWVQVRAQGGAGLEVLKSGQVLAKAVRSAFGNVLC